MKIFIALLLFLSQTAFAADAQVNNVLNLGGFNANLPLSGVLPASKASNLVLLGAAASTGATPGHYYWFNALNGASAGNAAQYQVPAGKTLQVYAMYFMDNSTAATVVTRGYGYGTAAFANDSATVPTGANYYGAGAVAHYSPFSFAGSGNSWQSFPFPISFPALSYPFYLAFASATQTTILIGELL